MKTFDELTQYYKGKKVLLTGHTGFKGSVMTMVLEKMGARVYGYALEAPTDPSLFETLKAGGIGPSESRIADIRDFEALKKYYDEVSPDVVIHMAAQPIVRESYRIPRETFETNVMGTVNLMECIRLSEKPVSALNVTTDKVYFNEEKPGYRYKEDDSLDGFDPYSNSKSCSELVTHSYFRSFFQNTGNVRLSTARAGNVIGGGDWAKDRIIPDAARAYLSGTPLTVRNPGSIRPFQHVFEPVFMYLDIVCEQAENGEKQGWYNVGPDACDCVTTGELVKKFCAALGEDITGGALTESAAVKASQKAAPHEAGLLMLDNTKIKETFGWQPVWHIGEAVKATADYTKAFRAGTEKANAELVSQLSAYIKKWDQMG